jgi:hypothetical protein
MALREQLDPTHFGYQPNGTYLPGQAEIRQRCAEIQSLWSPAERVRRHGWAMPVHMTLQQLADRDLWV